MRSRAGLAVLALLLASCGGGDELQTGTEPNANPSLTVQPDPTPDRSELPEER